MPLLLTIAALVTAAAAGPGAAERPDGARRCANRAEAPGARLDVSGKDNVRAGPVVFFSLARPTELERTRGQDPSLKVGIAVHAGPPVLLRIPRKARRRIALEYAVDRNGNFPEVRRVEDGQSLVRVTPCDPDTRRFSDGRRVGPWTAFPGGFVVKRAGCYPIEVGRRGKPFKRLRAGIGARCAPQNS
jgi:hypothetical protein